MLIKKKLVYSVKGYPALTIIFFKIAVAMRRNKIL